MTQPDPQHATLADGTVLRDLTVAELNALQWHEDDRDAGVAVEVTS